jgi:hypothetical protein
MKTFAEKPAQTATTRAPSGEHAAPPAPHPGLMEGPHERWTAQLQAMLNGGPRVAGLARTAEMLNQRPAGAVVQRAIKINPNFWYTDPRDIADALRREVDPVLLRKVQSMGRDGLTHPFDDWDQALEYAATLPDPGELVPVVEESRAEAGLGIHEAEEEKSPGVERASALSSLEGMGTMADLLHALSADVHRYMAPTGPESYDRVKKDYARVKKDVDRFNGILVDLAKTELWRGPFNVTVMVGDLKGFGDVTAGAKLARALKAFFGTIAEWRDVNVRLYLDKVANLQGPKDKKELESTIRTAKGVLGGANVGLENVDELAPLDKGIPSVSFAYPATNLANADFYVSQYGHDPFAPEESRYGSGPGFGALGVLPVPPEQRDAAVERGKKSEEGVLRTIDGLKGEFGLDSIHFGYFSIYKDRPKQFARNVVEHSPGTKIGVVLSRPQDEPGGIAASLAGMNCTVRTVSVARDGTRTNGAITPAQGGGKSPPVAKQVCLIILADGVEHPDMLALYYASDAPVGATGDQSFLEAYTMRGLKNKAGYRKPGTVPDIEYDVSEQQKGLYSQMTELAANQYLPKKDAPLGLKPIDVDREVHEVMMQKDLLFPIVMLINSTLQNAK